MELSPIEKLAVAQALFKSVKEQVETKNEYNLRGQVDAIYSETYEELRKHGAAPTSFDVEINGQKVGTYSITPTKATEERSEVELVIEDNDAFMAWASERGFAKMQADMKAVYRYFDETGDIPEGAKPVDVVIPAIDGGGIKSTTLRVNPEKVARAMGPQLEPAVYALLEGE